MHSDGDTIVDKQTVITEVEETYQDSLNKDKIVNVDNTHTKNK